jgi:hypothetical protein
MCTGWSPRKTSWSARIAPSVNRKPWGCPSMVARRTDDRLPDPLWDPARHPVGPRRPQLAFDTADEGVWVVDKSGRSLRSLGFRWSTTTWYGGLPGRPSWRAFP